MKHILSLCFLMTSIFAWSQEYYMVYLQPKTNTETFFSNPSLMLSQRAQERRMNRNITIDSKDVPLNQNNLQQIKNLDLEFVGASKWLNAVMVEVYDENTITQIQNLPFVQNVESLVRNSNPRTANTQNKFRNDQNRNLNYDYGYSDVFINQLNLRPLHDAGFSGQNTLIGVIDSGFPGVNTINAFAALRNENRIIDSKNFVNSNSIYDMHSHGTVVLATMAAKINNEYVGSAPDATYALYVSEDAPVETPKELMYWIQAAERADSVGVDVINTSLGYTTFDDPRYDFSYNDMDGNTTIISRGAKIAASRGIFLVNAMGNDGNNDWYYVSAPADTQEIFSIGAIDEYYSPASFSSHGPNAANVNKPNVSALGVYTPTYSPNGQLVASNGTSLASPVLAGAVASVISAFPNTSISELKQAIEQSSHLYPNYDTQLGFGVPNFGFLLEILKTNEILKADYQIYPNPTSTSFKVESNKEIKQIDLFSVTGMKLKSISNQTLMNVQGFAKGVYIIQITFKDGNQATNKLVIK
ncbi:S8 family peptidase [Faecalibacter bovis]|uniref:S8 family peptidase n=1 Tax=Faecalibacter bovis TaxID=2898187 RepID=A0ABX7XFC5_9FLAO|nr:S8 family peptidase [Faecalibacter bovis]QTV06646.1 S8 family peptidase [Faecalibacter bovis]